MFLFSTFYLTYHFSDTQLHRILVQRTFEGEENQNCYVLAVKLLMTLRPDSPYPLSETKLPFTIQQYWNKLITNFVEKKPLSVKESVLPLLGALLKQVQNEQVCILFN